jgi:hypothetical protein
LDVVMSGVMESRRDSGHGNIAANDPNATSRQKSWGGHSGAALELNHCIKRTA